MDKQKLLQRSWRFVLLVISLALVSYILYFHRLATLVPGYSAEEVRAYMSALTWHNIANNPLNAPFTVLTWLSAAVLGHHTLLTTRVIAAICGIVAVLLFYIVVRPRYSFWLAFLGTVLFATSAGFLHAARYGTGAILQMGILVLFAGILWYQRQANYRTLIGYAVCASFALLWYIPGLIWFELFAFVLLLRYVRRALGVTDIPHIIGGALTWLVVITPLVIACIHTPRLALTVLGLPQQLTPVVSHFGHNLLDAVSAIGVYSHGSATVWLGHAPLLNIIELTLAVIGAYCYFYLERTRRGVLIGGSIVLGLILISLGGPVSFAVIIPLLYLLVIKGVAYLLRLWMTVFPKNPIARGIGIATICIMVAFSVLYHARAYFVAWPHSHATHTIFYKHLD